MCTDEPSAVGHLLEVYLHDIKESVHKVRSLFLDDFLTHLEHNHGQDQVLDASSGEGPWHFSVSPEYLTSCSLV